MEKEIVVALISFGGVIIGFLGGWLTTWQGNKNVKKIEAIRQKHEIDMDNRKRTVQLCTKLAKHIGAVEGAWSELCFSMGDKDSQKEEFINRWDRLKTFWHANSGEINLYLSAEIGRNMGKLQEAFNGEIEPILRDKNNLSFNAYTQICIDTLKEIIGKES